MFKPLAVMLVTVSLLGCQTVYFDIMEKFGIAKRDILVDRVEDARDAQTQAQQRFKSALDELSSLINFDGDVQQAYDTLSELHESSQDAADTVAARIDKIESVADALFEEWQDEIAQSTSAKYQRSRQQLRQTQSSYQSLLRSMRRAESKMQPVLNSLKDNVLYLKHNFNARAIGAINLEFKDLKQEIQSLLHELNNAIKESNRFIAQLDKE